MEVEQIMSIHIQGIEKRFGGFIALRGVDLEIKKGELLALLGPSGSGKTTLLRIIAGLEAPDAGVLSLDGEDAGVKKARERGIGFVFQHYALFRHKTVLQNVAFGLEVLPWRRRPGRNEIRRRALDILKLVQLDWTADRLPSQLSGGQRQRVALARALVLEPKYLLLDEPFGALDAKVRKELRRWLRRLHEQIGVTSIFVTHDQEEALELADRVVILNEGRIEQVGTPDEVYSHPANSFVTQFLGSVNLFHGRIRDGVAQVGTWEVDAPEHAGASGAVFAFVRPHEIELRRRFIGKAAVLAQVRQVRSFGSAVKLDLTREEGDGWLEVELSHEEFQNLRPQVGEWLLARPRRFRIFPQPSEAARWTA